MSGDDRDEVEMNVKVKKSRMSCPEIITNEGSERYVVALRLPVLESNAPLDRILARARLLEGRCTEIA